MYSKENEAPRYKGDSVDWHSQYRRVRNELMALESRPAEVYFAERNWTWSRLGRTFGPLVGLVVTAALWAGVTAVTGSDPEPVGPAKQGTVVITKSEPYCPTEDSCIVEYHDGAWHIKEVTP